MRTRDGITFTWEPPWGPGLPAEDPPLPLPRLVHAPLDVAVLLRRDGEEDDAPGEGLHRFDAHEAHGGAEQSGDLGVVAAGVSRPRRGVGPGGGAQFTDEVLS